MIYFGKESKYYYTTYETQALPEWMEHYVQFDALTV